DHLARGLHEATFVAIGRRQGPQTGHVKRRAEQSQEKPGAQPPYVPRHGLLLRKCLNVRRKREWKGRRQRAKEPPSTGGFAYTGPSARSNAGPARDQDSPSRMDLSVVVPVRNEAENVAAVADEIRAALAGRFQFEIIFADDGSSDATSVELKK